MLISRTVVKVYVQILFLYICVTVVHTNTEYFFHAWLSV